DGIRDRTVTGVQTCALPISDLGKVGGAEAGKALVLASADPDRRVRRAVAIALGFVADGESAAALRKLIESDRAEDVAGAAEISQIGRASCRERGESWVVGGA